MDKSTVIVPEARVQPADGRARLSHDQNHTTLFLNLSLHPYNSTVVNHHHHPAFIIFEYQTREVTPFNDGCGKFLVIPPLSHCHILYPL
jgi:hypothetical protein